MWQPNRSELWSVWVGVWWAERALLHCVITRHCLINYSTIQANQDSLVVSKSHSHPINTLPAVKEGDMLVTSWTRWCDGWQVFSELSKLMKEHINVYAFWIWISRLSIWNKTKTSNLGHFCLEIPNPWLHLTVSIKLNWDKECPKIKINKKII